VIHPATAKAITSRLLPDRRVIRFMKTSGASSAC
jgi:hypothetical protein